MLGRSKLGVEHGKGDWKEVGCSNQRGGHARRVTGQSHLLTLVARQVAYLGISSKYSSSRQESKLSVLMLW